MVNRTADENITHVVERTFVLFKVGGGKPVADHHVIAFENFLHHCGSILSRVGVIAIDHYVSISVNILEHGADDISLALARLMTNYCTSLLSQLSSVVSGIIVIHVDSGVGKNSPKISHHLGNSNCFVIARNEHSNFCGINLTLINRLWLSRKDRSCLICLSQCLLL